MSTTFCSFFFNTISTRFRRHDSMNLPELRENIRNALMPALEVHLLNFMCNIKKWIPP